MLNDKTLKFKRDLYMSLVEIERLSCYLAKNGCNEFIFGIVNKILLFSVDLVKMISKAVEEGIIEKDTLKIDLTGTISMCKDILNYKPLQDTERDLKTLRECVLKMLEDCEGI